MRPHEPSRYDTDPRPDDSHLRTGAIDLVAVEPPDAAQRLLGRLLAVPLRQAVAGGAAFGMAALLAWVLLAPDAPRNEDLLPLAAAAASGTIDGGSGSHSQEHAGPDGRPGSPIDAGGPDPGFAGGEPTEALPPPAGGEHATGAGGDLAPGAGVGPGRLLVHAAGAVQAPGLYQVAGGARVGDLVHAAGGPTADADLDRLNLAQPLADGMRVYVPHRGEDPPVGSLVEGPTPAPGGGAGPSGPGGGPEGAPPLVHLNTAGASELETLPGIGPALAAAILAHRDEHGPFRSVDDLIAVSGIGEAKLAAVRDLVTVG